MQFWWAQKSMFSLVMRTPRSLISMSMNPFFRQNFPFSVAIFTKSDLHNKHFCEYFTIGKISSEDFFAFSLAKTTKFPKFSSKVVDTNRHPIALFFRFKTLLKLPGFDHFVFWNWKCPLESLWKFHLGRISRPKWERAASNLQVGMKAGRHSHKNVRRRNRPEEASTGRYNSNRERHAHQPVDQTRRSADGHLGRRRRWWSSIWSV